MALQNALVVIVPPRYRYRCALTSRYSLPRERRNFGEPRSTCAFYNPLRSGNVAVATISRETSGNEAATTLFDFLNLNQLLPLVHLELERRRPDVFLVLWGILATTLERRGSRGRA